eukprot:gene3402-3675_t
MASHEEYNFSLNQYMVVLDKPIGVTLAPDPTTGVVYVQDIQPGLSAAESKLVLVGDKLLLCSAVFGDDMWLASDLQRTRWAVNNRPGKVKLVFERSDGEPLPAWYFKGREGISTWEVPELQLPIRFATSIGGELSESLCGAGRSIAVSFNRCLSPPAPEQQDCVVGDHELPLPAAHVMLWLFEARQAFTLQVRRRLRPGLAARRARAEELLLLLAEAAESPEVEVSSPSSRTVAVAAVSQVMGVGVDEVLLQEVHRLLVVRAKERFTRVMLTWRYGGLSAEVSGELLGGWTQRVAMRKCMKQEGCLGASKGHFYLELKGLHPGRYHYKYIIDNTWAVDPSAPMSLDSQGNWNNMLEVKQPPTIETPEQMEHFATLQAACEAFETKLRPHSSSG